MNAESRDFEYDEDMEAGDEGFSEDESFEADGEDSEADGEADGEADEGSDEMLEADGEGDEGADEMLEADGEADEGVDEAAISASTQLQRERDSRARAAFRSRLVADQRRGVIQANSTQRSIQSQIRSVQPGGPARVQTVGTLQGAGVVTAILPNGRRSRMRIIPTVAPISEVNRLKSVVTTNERRQAIATSKNSRAIRSLASAQASAVKKLTAQQVKSDQELGKRIVEGHTRLDKRITKELSGGSGSLDKHGKRMAKMLKRQRQRSIMNSVLLATSVPFFAAYGERDNPFGKKNLIMTGSTLGFMLGDEMLDSFAGKSRGARGLATAWSYAAPAANGATAYFLLRNKQNERFISSVATVAGGTHTIEMKDFVKKGSLSEFKGKAHAVAVTLVGSGVAVATAELVEERSKLKLTLKNPDGTAAAGQVAWIVDTYESATATTTT